MTQNKQYDHEYKVQAIKLAREIGSAKAAAELGVPKNTMYGWMRAVREGRLDIGKGAHMPQDALTLNEELINLRTRVKQQEKEIKRLKEVDAYHDKMLKQKKEKDKEAYLETIKFMLVGQETPENYKSILQDWEKAYERQQKRVDDLYKEIKEIKKLRV